MNDKVIIQTIRDEIQHAQQPLLERIDELERLLDDSNEHIQALNLMMIEVFRHFPLGSLGSVAAGLRENFQKISDDQKDGDAAQSMLYWAESFEHQIQCWQDYNCD